MSVAMPPLYCLYGSMTGKAQSIAEQIVQQGLSKGFEVIVLISGTVTIHNDESILCIANFCYL